MTTGGFPLWLPLIFTKLYEAVKLLTPASASQLDPHAQPPPPWNTIQHISPIPIFRATHSSPPQPRFASIVSPTPSIPVQTQSSPAPHPTVLSIESSPCTSPPYPILKYNLIPIPPLLPPVQTPQIVSSPYIHPLSGFGWRFSFLLTLVILLHPLTHSV